MGEVERYTGLDDLLAAHRAGKKVTARAVVRELALIKRAHEIFGDGPDVPVPAELLNLVGVKLIGQRAWQREQSEAMKAMAQRRHADWQAAADAVWAKRPEFSNAAVAGIIAKQFPGANPDTIRRKITKP